MTEEERLKQRNEIIEFIYKQEMVEKIAHNEAIKRFYDKESGVVDDVIGEVYYRLMKVKTDKLQELYQLHLQDTRANTHLVNYIGRMVKTIGYGYSDACRHRSSIGAYIMHMSVLRGENLSLSIDKDSQEGYEYYQGEDEAVSSEGYDVSDMDEDVRDKWEELVELMNKHLTREESEFLIDYLSLNRGQKGNRKMRRQFYALIQKLEKFASGYKKGKRGPKPRDPSLMVEAKEKKPRASGYKPGKQRQRRKVEQYNTKGEYIRTFNSTMEAAEAMGCASVSISHTILGITQTCKGYRWKYAEKREELI